MVAGDQALEFSEGEEHLYDWAQVASVYKVPYSTWLLLEALVRQDERLVASIAAPHFLFHANTLFIRTFLTFSFFFQAAAN